LGGSSPRASTALIAGVLVGLGFAVKVSDALVGLGLAIALAFLLGRQRRRLVPPLAALGAGFAVPAGAAVAIGGSAMLEQSSRASDMVSIGSPWRVIRTIVHLVVSGTAATDIVKFGAIALAVLLAVLLIRGLTGIQAARDLSTDPGGPAYRPAAANVAFALVLAWLFAWPYVLPWYDALAWALLPLVRFASAPAVEALGWLLLARTAALGFGYLPARQTGVTIPRGLAWLQPVTRHGVTPVVLAVATAWLVVLMAGSRRSGSSGWRAAQVSEDTLPATLSGAPPRVMPEAGQQAPPSQAPAREARRPSEASEAPAREARRPSEASEAPAREAR
jgi:hypothetical protein